MVQRTKCPYCHHVIQPDWPSCPYCKHILPKRGPKPQPNPKPPVRARDATVVAVAMPADVPETNAAYGAVASLLKSRGVFVYDDKKLRGESPCSCGLARRVLAKVAASLALPVPDVLSNGHAPVTRSQLAVAEDQVYQAARTKFKLPALNVHTDPFPDVPAGDPLEPTLSRLKAAGLAVSDPNGNFGPRVKVRTYDLYVGLAHLRAAVTSLSIHPMPPPHHQPAPVEEATVIATTMPADVPEHLAAHEAVASLLKARSVFVYRDGSLRGASPCSCGLARRVLARVATGLGLPVPNEPADGPLPITRSQLAVAEDQVYQAARAKFGLSGQDVHTDPFPDIPADDPLGPTILRLKAAGLAVAYPDGNFRPGTTLSTYEVYVGLDHLRAAIGTLTPPPPPPPVLVEEATLVAAAMPKDVPESLAARVAVASLLKAGFVFVYDDGSLRGASLCTRGLARRVLSKVATSLGIPLPNELPEGREPFTRSQLTAVVDQIYEAARLKRGLPPPDAHTDSSSDVPVINYDLYVAVDGLLTEISALPLPVVKAPNPPKPNPPKSDPVAVRNSYGYLTKTDKITGKEMVFVPEGDFILGRRSSALFKENPEHHVHLPGFWISTNLVTVAEFKKFTDSQNYPFEWKKNAPAWGWDHPDYPMVMVTAEDAEAYCRWAGGYLPTGDQWEAAARGEKGLTYPWGNTFENTCCRCSFQSYADAGSPTIVGSYAKYPSPYGLLDMAGNVWQWCSTRLPDGGREKRGGCWSFADEAAFRSYHRTSSDPTARDDSIGFRMCQSN